MAEAAAAAAAERDRLDRVRRFQFEKFNPDAEEFDFYIQRFELEILRFGLTGDANANSRRTLLLTCIGPDAFKMLVDHFRPTRVIAQTYDALKTALDGYFRKQVCTMAERVQFTRRIRREDETIAIWLNTLRGLTGHCNFGNSLDERLRDQLFLGINNPSWQQELFRQHPNDDATLAQVEATALILERASVQQQRLQSLGNGSSETTTRRVQQGRQLAKRNLSGTTAPRKLQPRTDCFKCGNGSHKKGEKCPAEGKQCKACGQLHHFSNVCIKKGNATIRSNGNDTRQQRRRVNRLHQDDGSEGNGADEDEWENADVQLNTINAMSTQGRKAFLHAILHGQKVKMLYDPGAAQTVISEATWKQIGSPKLAQAASLIAYTQVPVETLGTATVTVTAFKQTKRLQLYVVKKHDQPLFGLDWCISFGLQMPKGVTICNVTPTAPSATSVKRQQTAPMHDQVNPELQQMLHAYESIFDGRMGTIVGHKAVVHIREGATPKVFTPRPVAFPLQAGVEKELDRLVANDVLEQVDSATMPIEWASPTVCVVKPTGAIRICGDFKVTINPHIIVDPHPLPTFEQIATKLNGGRYFSKIDLKDAYLQMEVAEASRKYLIIATHKGYFRYKRLPFGVSFAPSLFQKTMENVLAGLPGTAVYIDDVIVSGSTVEESLGRLRKVFERLHKLDIKTHLQKCEFLRESVTYLGHRIDATGIHPTNERIEAIRQLPTPTNAAELRSFLGSINYYAKFIPRLQPLCTSLHRLTMKNAAWTWTENDEKRVQQLKSILTSSDTLVHYDGAKPLVLSTDASDRGLGAVLMHRFPDGTEKPIAYASRTLKDVETRYSTIDKEALAIVFGVTKFHQYLYGRRFTLKTDHKPLERIFGENREIPKILNNRLIRWALTLSAYDYAIQYVEGINNTPADVLSRLPMPGKTPSDNEKLGNIYQLLNLKLDDLQISKSELQRQSIADPVIARIIAHLERGWPEDKKALPSELHTYCDKKQALSYEDKILMWQGRIIIPTRLQQGILRMLHEGHPGAAAMKAMARFHVWWPHIDEEIEQFVRNCDPCQETRPRQGEVPLFSWAVPSEPWARLHIDYAGPFEGRSWLIIVDAFSKWLEVKPTRDTSTAATIRLLRSVFAQFGLPRTIVSDNGTNFASEEFKEFCASNNIKHIRSTPYHPKTNGLAERAVRTFKSRFTAAKTTTADQHLRLQRFLISYRNTPHSTTGRTPAELLLGRRLRTRLDLLKPDVRSNIDTALYKQQLYHDRNSRPRSFFEGEEVWVQRTDGKGHVKGMIHRRTAEHSYLVKIEGKICRKHADHLRSAQQTAHDVQVQPTEDPPDSINLPSMEHTPAPQAHPTLFPPIPQQPLSTQVAPAEAPQEQLAEHPAVDEATTGQAAAVVDGDNHPPTPRASVRQKEPLPIRSPSKRIRKPVVKPYDDYLMGKKQK